MSFFLTMDGESGPLNAGMTKEVADQFKTAESILRKPTFSNRSPSSMDRAITFRQLKNGLKSLSIADKPVVNSHLTEAIKSGFQA